MTGFQILMFSTAGIIGYRKDLDIMHKIIIDISIVLKIIWSYIKKKQKQKQTVQIDILLADLTILSKKAGKGFILSKKKT